MGFVAADFNGDRRLDILVNNLYGEGSTLYENLGRGSSPTSIRLGDSQATRYLTGFGVATLDPANDGRLHVDTAMVT